MEELVGTCAIHNVPGDDCMLHVSLSRDLYLKEFQFRPFLDKLEQRLLPFKRFNIGFVPEALGLYQNEENTRHFLALDVHSKCHDELLKIVNQVNGVVDLFQQPKFYHDPKFHVSLLWSLPDNAEIIAPSAIRHVNNKMQEDKVLLEKVSKFTNNVNFITCSIRNRVYNISLS